MLSDVDPFLGCEASDLPPREGLAARWFFPKAQVGNTHPGACLPFDPISVLPYSGAYPTGYGRYRENTEGQPTPRWNGYYASGFSHIHHSGPGRIRAYYNYLRVTPHCGTLHGIGKRWALADETASPGRYACGLVGTGISAELTCAPMAALHRYTFPASEVALVAVDWSLGGILEDGKRSFPSRVDLRVTEGGAEGVVVFEGVPLYVALSCDLPASRRGTWYANDPLTAGRLVLDGIERDAFRPFGCYFTGAVASGTQVEIRLGFSFRSLERARARLAACASGFDAAAAAATESWCEHLGRIEVEGADEDQRVQLATAHYRSCLKPALARDESPWWGDGPYAFDFSTLWDQYKTQLPLCYLLHPAAAREIVGGLAKAAEHHGWIPVCYLLSDDLERFTNQASGLGELTLGEACQKDVGGVEWAAVLPLLERSVTSGKGAQFLAERMATPFTHHLDLCDAHAALAAAWAHHGVALRGQPLAARARWWPAAYDLETGLLDATNTYEGGVWNYSFRLQHDMAGRIQLAGGEARFIELLDRFFGYTREPVTQLRLKPYGDLWHKGVGSCSFQGLNNEPDMETPYAYCWVGRHDRTCEVVREVIAKNFTVGLGGLPGNDDSGALSSWYLWSSLGLFPVAGSDLYLIASPTVPVSRWRLPGGELVIEAPDASAANIYVTEASWNGRPLRHCWLRHRDIAAGGTLVLRQGPRPTGWAAGSRPPGWGLDAGRDVTTGIRRRAAAT